MKTYREGAIDGLRAAWMAVVVAVPLASGCSKAVEPSGSSASNWLVCDRLADCASSRAVDCDDGYCVDEDGERLRAEAASNEDGGSSSTLEVEATPGSFDGRWTKLPDPPLSGRVGSLVAAVGDLLVVAGGIEWLCPPGADCATPQTPPYVDGAAYVVNTGEWKVISRAPKGFRDAAKAVVGDDVYLLDPCHSGPTCLDLDEGTFLRYRSDVDEWDLLPSPPERGHDHLIGVPDGVVAYSGSDENGEQGYHRFLASEERWVTLPDDPLPPVYDRFIVEHDGRFLLFGSPLDREQDTKVVASYDPETDDWESLTSSNGTGFQVWRAGSLMYLNPHFSGAGGGIYDPSTDTWSPLPDPPHHDLTGIIGKNEASYEDTDGWVLDTRTGDWLEIGPRPDSGEIHGEEVAAFPGHGMVVFGGQTWASGEGQLLDDTWLWIPPAAKASP